MMMAQNISGIIVCMGSANERRRYNVTSIPIARAHDQIDRICSRRSRTVKMDVE